MQLLKEYEDTKLLDHYDVYDCLLNYWNEKLQDDVYIIKNFGYDSGRELKFEYEKKRRNGEVTENKSKVKSFDGEIIPKEIIETEYFMKEKDEIRKLVEKAERLDLELSEMLEEESVEDGLFNEVLNSKGNGILKKVLNARIKEIENKKTLEDEYRALCTYLKKQDEKDTVDKEIKILCKELDCKVREKYSKLSIDEIKYLLFDLKWMHKIQNDVKELMDQILNSLSSRILLIAKRYEYSLKQIEEDTEHSRESVISALKRMGYKW